MRCGGCAGEDGIHAEGRQGLRAQEGVDQGHVLQYAVRVHIADGLVQHGVAEAEGRLGELQRDGGVDRRIIALETVLVGIVGLAAIEAATHRLGELGEDDPLILSDVHDARGLEILFLGPGAVG
ncbi:hypothetical protein D3C80_1548120 [compost metagenome]